MNRAPILRFPQPEVRTFSYDHRTKEILLRVYVGDTLCSDITQTLTALETLVAALRRNQEYCERQIKTDGLIEAQRRRHLDLARSYQRLRLVGLKHRAALRALFVDPAFSDLHGDLSDFNYWVKLYGLETERGAR